jgi:hypothetical protein
MVYFANRSISSFGGKDLAFDAAVAAIQKRYNTSSKMCVAACLCIMLRLLEPVNAWSQFDYFNM